MKKLLLTTAIAIVALATPAMAFYTECTVTRDMDLATRPNGPSEPRYMGISKGGCDQTRVKLETPRLTREGVQYR
jgi:hypothetical protein